MHAEIASKSDNAARCAGWIFYDGDCPTCSQWAHRFESILARRGFRLLTLQSPDASQRLGLSGRALFHEMHLLMADGRHLGGADAIVEITRRTWWAWPVWLASHLPGVMPLLRAIYRVIAANRSCASGVCQLPQRHVWLDWLPLLLLPATAITARNTLPPWIFMWLLAFTIFLGCKWLMLRRTRAHPTRAAALAYLFTWPGMDAHAFLEGHTEDRPNLRQWLTAGAEALAGAILIWIAAAHSLRLHPLLTGWIAMVGMVLLLHFGIFQLLTFLWRAAGRDAKPLMHAPLRSTSLAEFWGGRWNSAFSTLAGELVLRRLARPLGIAQATLAVFLVSGLIHDLVISLPARGGYGLPTAYFLLQGIAILFERSQAGRALGLGHGWPGRVFALVIAAAPAFWLLHPWFVYRVVLPMLDAIGTTGGTL